MAFQIARLGQVAFILSLLVVGGCGGKDDADSGKGGAASAAPDFTLTAKQLYDENKADAEATAKKYAGKTLQLEGTAKMVGGSDADVWLSLETEESDALGLKCELSEKEPWGKVVPGQPVTVKVRWPERSTLLYLTEGAIVETGQSPAVTISAADLAKAYSADSEGTDKKYKDKWMIVDGVVAKKDENEVGAVGVFLAGDGNTQVNASFAATEASETKAVKEGDSIKVVGQFFAPGSKDDSVQLIFCRLVGE